MQKIIRELLILICEMVLTVLLFCMIRGVNLFDPLDSFGLLMAVIVGAMGYILLLLTRAIVWAIDRILKKIAGFNISYKIEWTIIGILWSIIIIFIIKYFSVGF